jgi:hypothetical protein
MQLGSDDLFVRWGGKKRCRPVGTGTGDSCTGTEHIFMWDISIWYMNDSEEIKVISPTCTFLQVNCEARFHFCPSKLLSY